MKPPKKKTIKTRETHTKLGKLKKGPASKTNEKRKE